MKKIIIALFCLMTFASLAQEKTEKPICRDIAHQIAVEAYSARNGEGMIFTKNKFRPLIEQDTITHFIQVLDGERNTNTLVTVIFNKRNCQLISVD